MNPTPTYRIWKVFAGLLFLGLAVFEAMNDLNGVARAGFFARANFVGVVLVPLWTLAGVLLLIGKPLHSRPYIVAAGAIAAIGHGATLRVGRTTATGVSGGALFIVAAVVLAALLYPIWWNWLAARGVVERRHDRIDSDRQAA